MTIAMYYRKKAFVQNHYLITRMKWRDANWEIWSCSCMKRWLPTTN